MLANDWLARSKMSPNVATRFHQRRAYEFFSRRRTDPRQVDKEALETRILQLEAILKTSE